MPHKTYLDRMEEIRDIKAEIREEEMEMNELVKRSRNIKQMIEKQRDVILCLKQKLRKKQKGE